jgi:DNA-binding transcriptional regulator LsrR (DeoR family)
VADALPAAEAPAAAPVVPISGAVPGHEQGNGPAELALRFAERLGARLYPLPAPAIAGAAARDELLANDAVRPTVEMFDRVAVALVGIGPAHRFPGAPEHAAGHLLVHVYDAAGRAVGGDLAARAIAMSSEQLRRARVVAVAGGPGKRAAILGALRTGLVDTLFTDSANAAHALGEAA